MFWAFLDMSVQLLRFCGCLKKHGTLSGAFPTHYLAKRVGNVGQRSGV